MKCISIADDTWPASRGMSLELTASSRDKPPQMEGFPMKEWSVEIYLLDQNGKKVPAKCFTKAVYNLHPSFANPTQSTS